jgi:hypothetical protein
MRASNARRPAERRLMRKAASAQEGEKGRGERKGAGRERARGEKGRGETPNGGHHGGRQAWRGAHGAGVA